MFQRHISSKAASIYMTLQKRSKEANKKTGSKPVGSWHPLNVLQTPTWMKMLYTQNAKTWPPSPPICFHACSSLKLHTMCQSNERPRRPLWYRQPQPGMEPPSTGLVPALTRRVRTHFDVTEAQRGTPNISRQRVKCTE